MVLSNNQEDSGTMFKYPTFILGIVSITSIIFSVGAAWAVQNYKQERDDKEVRLLINALADKISIKFEDLEKRLDRIEKKLN